VRQGDRYNVGPVDYFPDGLVPAAVPEAQPIVQLNLIRSELGQISLQGWSGFFIGTPPDDVKADLMGDGERMIATGISPAVRSPRNAVVNAALAHDPELRLRLSVRLEAPRSAGPAPSPVAAGEAEGTAGAKVTSADVLEALHRATGMSIVSDYYTRLFRPEEVSVQNQPLFEALNHLADAMHMRWRKEAGRGTAVPRLGPVAAWASPRGPSRSDGQREGVERSSYAASFHFASSLLRVFAFSVEQFRRTLAATRRIRPRGLPESVYRLRRI